MAQSLDVTLALRPIFPGTKARRCVGSHTVSVPLAQRAPPLCQSVLLGRAWKATIQKRDVGEQQKTARHPPGAQPAPDHRVGRRSSVRRADHFFGGGFQNTVFEPRLGQHLFEFTVLVFEFLELARFAQIHRPEQALPTVEAPLGEVMRPANLQDVFTLVSVSSKADFLFGRVALAFPAVWVFSRPLD